MNLPLDELAAALAELDAKLKAIAERRVDATDPAAMKSLARQPHPLDEAGIRDKAESLMQRLLPAYAEADNTWRREVRNLFRRYTAFAWAVPNPRDRSSESSCRNELLLFSILDQGQDPRDAKLWLDDIVAGASAHGIRLAPLLREVAAMSGTDNPHGWGSTRAWLDKAAIQDYPDQ